MKTKVETLCYPIIFKPIYKEMIWGGDRLASMFGRNLPTDFGKTRKIGESWDISCRPNEMSIIENGPFAGSTFAEYIAKDRVRILGTRLANCERFPLLVKIIDANDTLSIQVHPDDNFARQKDASDCGKCEMWYILHPPDSGHLIIGLKPGITQKKLAEAYENGTVEDCLNHLPVAAGDVIDIPAGLVHALTKGTIVAEIQQNSDITYRLYDFNRPGLDGNLRPLHVEDALAVSDFEERIPKRTVSAESNSNKNNENELIPLIHNSHFATVKYVLSNSVTEKSNPSTFFIFTCVDGDAIVTTGEFSVELCKGKSVFIPAGTGTYSIAPINGKAILLKSFVPEIS